MTTEAAAAAAGPFVALFPSAMMHMKNLTILNSYLCLPLTLAVRPDAGVVACMSFVCIAGRMLRPLFERLRDCEFEFTAVFDSNSLLPVLLPPAAS